MTLNIIWPKAHFLPASKSPKMGAILIIVSPIFLCLFEVVNRFQGRSDSLGFAFARLFTNEIQHSFIFRAHADLKFASFRVLFDGPSAFLHPKNPSSKPYHSGLQTRRKYNFTARSRSRKRPHPLMSEVLHHFANSVFRDDGNFLVRLHPAVYASRRHAKGLRQFPDAHAFRLHPP